MKRAPLFVFAGTVAGLAGILSFHTHPPASGLGALSASAGNSASRSPGTSAHSHGGTSQHSSGGSSGSSGSGTAQSVTGSTVQYGFGQLAVKVTVRGGRIVNVAVPSIQTAEPYSQQLASQAIPTLRSEVLSAQSANIQGVSGATYTSEAYAQSLQSALSKLHLA